MQVGQCIDPPIWDCPTTAHISYSGHVLPCYYASFCHASGHLGRFMPAWQTAGDAAVHAEVLLCMQRCCYACRHAVVHAGMLLCVQRNNVSVPVVPMVQQGCVVTAVCR